MWPALLLHVVNKVSWYRTETEVLENHLVAASGFFRLFAFVVIVSVTTLTFVLNDVDKF